MIRKLLVANRGEIARRIFRTCRSLGIQTVAVYAENSDLHVRDADAAVTIDSFLDAEQIVAAATKTGADAIHPGYGFLSENAHFARAVEAAGLIWIGPAPDAIEAMGDKIRAKKLVAAAGVPVLDGDETFPLLIKAAAGGGGRGMRVVTEPGTLRSELAAAAAEAQSAFGDGTVFTEPYLPRARHVEVQVLGDRHGRIWVVGDRDCSVQRRHQKIVEEAPAFGLSSANRDSLHRYARAAAEAVGYQSAGTVEFLVDGERIFFLEMNTRLQVEHPVTEAVTGLDLVAWQVAIAEGRELPPAPPEINGHAIEVRLYAEDPAAGFAPQTGTLRAFDFDAPGIRVDSGVEAGTSVGVRYDAMLSKIIAYGPDRPAAIRLLADALRRGTIHGITTNLALLRAILADDDFLAERVDTALLDRKLAAWTSTGEDHAVRKAALAAALGSAVRTVTSGSVQARIPVAWRNVPSQERVRSYRSGGVTYDVTYAPRGGRLESGWLPGVRAVEVSAEQPGQGPRPVRGGTDRRLQVHEAGGRLAQGVVCEVVLDDHGVLETFRVAVVDGGVDVDGPAGAFDFHDVPKFEDPSANLAAGSLLASMPGLVVALHVAEGDQVAAGDPIVVLEAMKMQQTLTAPADGVVSALSVVVGKQVAAGEVLAVIDAGPANKVADAGPANKVADAGPANKVADAGPAGKVADADSAGKVADAGRAGNVIDSGELK